MEKTIPRTKEGAARTRRPFFARDQSSSRPAARILASSSLKRETSCLALVTLSTAAAGVTRPSGPVGRQGRSDQQGQSDRKDRSDPWVHSHRQSLQDLLHR